MPKDPALMNGLKKLGGKLAHAFGSARHELYMARNPKYSRFQVGEWSYGEPEVIYWDAGATLTIGRFCSIARGVRILLGGEHHTEWTTSYPFPLLWPEARAFPGYPGSKGDVTLGHEVWVGHDALILSGVTIGDGAVIGAGSVVSRDVAPFDVVAGNPARVVRSRFSPLVVEALERIRWWEWPTEQVLEALPLLLSPDVDSFIRKYDRA
jgi:acetyltransferase-like isoleucine patch superfamily enzyme